MPAKIRVMLVDDSAVVRGLMRRALEADPLIEIAATAVEGQMALDVLRRNKVDVVILDIEMPGMDGLTALPEIMKIAPETRVIMASTLSMRNAEMSLRAIELGASDYLAKPSSKEPGQVQEFYRELIAKVKALVPHPKTPAKAPGNVAAPAAAVAMNRPRVAAAENVAAPRKNLSAQPAGALAIASSTGGPQALLNIFESMKGLSLRVPIFITQHMPPNFTTILAQHISKTSGADCHEAADGEEVKAGVIYVAPGDFHMTVERAGRSLKLRLDKNPPENFCRPSADPMLRSLVKIYGGQLLLAVLTGLGADGSRGAAEVVAAGGTVIAQDEATSVVYGMPKAVVDAKLASAVLPLNQIAPYLIKAVA